MQLHRFIEGHVLRGRRTIWTCVRLFFLQVKLMTSLAFLCPPVFMGCWTERKNTEVRTRRERKVTRLSYVGFIQAEKKTATAANKKIKF